MKKTMLAAGLLASFGSAHAVELYSNGPAVSGVPPVSIIRAGGTLLGAGVQSNVQNVVAEDFTVTGAPWTVERLFFFSYQSFAANAFTFTGVTWSVVAGDVTTGVVVSSGTSPVTNAGLEGYRVSPTTLTNTDRAIFRIGVDVTDFVLPPGNYWLRWSLAGTLASGPWQPPTADGVIGNAAQSVSNATFVPLVDAGDTFGIAAPFVIDGTFGDDIFADDFESPPPP
jgi:hypothetical protein